MLKTAVQLAAGTWAILLAVPSEAMEGAPKVSPTPNRAFQALLAAEAEEVFEPLPDIPGSSGELLINGRPAERRFFPTVFRKVSGPECTAALIGPATMLTAAHCTTHNLPSRFRIGGTEVRGRCQHAPGYHPTLQPSHDWSLCLLEADVTEIRYETVASLVPSIGTKVTLTGYGCTEEGGSGGDRTLRVGVAQLVTRPTPAPVEASTIYTHTNIGAGGVAVCPGDSGGPLFRIQGESLNNARTLVGVNSRAIAGGISLFSAAGSTAGLEFINTWAERHHQKVCGTENMPENCR